MIIAGSTLKVTLAINEDIGMGGTATIGYSNSGGSGSWVATVEDSETGQISYTIPAGSLTRTGVWNVWGTYVFEDGRRLITPAKQFTVYAEGTVDK